MIRAVIFSATLIAPGLAVAQGLEVQTVTDGVWAIVGEKEQRSPENLANNATFGLVVTEAGGTGTDVNGAPLDFTHGRRLEENRGVVASNGPNHEAVIAALRATA